MYQSCETGRTYDVLKYIVDRKSHEWYGLVKTTVKRKKAIFLTTKMVLPKQI